MGGQGEPLCQGSGGEEQGADRLVRGERRLWPRPGNALCGAGLDLGSADQRGAGRALAWPPGRLVQKPQITAVFAALLLAIIRRTTDGVENGVEASGHCQDHSFLGGELELKEASSASKDRKSAVAVNDSGNQTFEIII